MYLFLGLSTCSWPPIVYNLQIVFSICKLDDGCWSQAGLIVPLQICQAHCCHRAFALAVPAQGMLSNRHLYDSFPHFTLICTQRSPIHRGFPSPPRVTPHSLHTASSPTSSHCSLTGVPVHVSFIFLWVEGPVEAASWGWGLWHPVQACVPRPRWFLTHA